MFWCRLEGKAVDPANLDDGVIWIAEDITERKRAETELRQHQDHLEELVRARTVELQETSSYLNNLLDHANAPIIVWDPSLRITRFNHAFEKLTGRRAGEVLGRELGFLFPPDRKQECLEQIHRTLAGECWETVEIPIQHVDGAVRTLLWNSASLFEEDGTTVSSTIAQGQDITERKMMEADSLQHQKMESIGQLAAGIAHEINTPVQYIGDNARFLKEAVEDLEPLWSKYDELEAAVRAGKIDTALADEVDALREEADLEYFREQAPRAIDHALEGVSRVATIVRAMKDFSHPGPAEMTPTNLNRAIESTVTVCRNEWKYRADLEMDFDESIPTVTCVPGEINQVILNMVVNAAHAIGDEVGKESGNKGKITVATRAEGDRVKISIGDTGSGIREEHRSRIFDPFFTTKDVGKGTGQGLAIAYNVIVKKHGGKIDFETEVGKGTTFHIHLPVSNGPGAGQ